MSKVRLLVLLLGPLPLIGGSLALSGWVKPEAGDGLSPHNVALPSSRGALYAAEVSPNRASPPRTVDLTQPCTVAAEKLSQQLGPGCRRIVRPPFVIAGDLSDKQLGNWHDRTIRPAAEALADCYFATPPNEPVTVLLFSGEQSYNHYAEKLFGERNISIYGYYKPGLRTLVMNIDTGGGTLVHELTHALMDFDFPKVPDWFNEGLASLHEQCQFREGADGRWIEGLENWRLPGLQKSIRQKRLRSLSSLIQDNDFRGPLEGTNYAQARYFCLFMQRKGVLRDYFHAFRKTQANDPFGHAAVAAVFPAKSWEELDREFQAWALALKQ